ncbi:MAG TPA: isoprenylcysteine carboxylmethyltransferase family protein [Terracidiphilus sp.]|nr:isoprenylcysteine carboxylmethyltransferase family protein [Terracidiphilus sp.]
MNLSPSLIGYPWIALGAVWLAAAAGKRPTLRTQTDGHRMLHIFLALLGFCMLAHPWFHRGWLGLHFLADTRALFYAGFAITVAGTLFAIWARFALGRNWSGRPSVMAGHELVTSGPYAVARHPIYTGLLLAAAGTALAIGEWRCILALALILAAFLVKITAEEQLMMQTFPNAYPQYRKRVKALIPGVL